MVCKNIALAEKIAKQRKGMAKKCEAEAVGLGNADHDRAGCQGGHGTKIAEPRNTEEVHRDASDLTEYAKRDTDKKKNGFFAFFNNSEDRIRCSYTGRPGAFSREHLGTEALIHDRGVDYRSQRHTDQHREHEIRSSHDDRNTDRQDHAVRSGECCRRNGCLQKILSVDTAVFFENTDRDP